MAKVKNDVAGKHQARPPNFSSEAFLENRIYIIHSA